MVPKYRKLSLTLAALLFGILGVSDIVAVWNYLLSAIASNYWRSGLVGFAVLLLLFAFYENLLGFFGIYLSKPLGNRIKDYLHVVQGYTLISTNFESGSFKIVAERDGSKFKIERHPTLPLLQLSMNRVADETVSAFMASCSEISRADLKDRIGIALEQMDGLAHLQISSTKSPANVEVGLQIPLDSSFNEAKLQEGIWRINKAGVLIGLVWNRWIREQYLRTNPDEDSRPSSALAGQLDKS